MSRRIAPENRINDITRAAITVFRQKGFRQAQMADIAKEAGVAPGTLYTYFESKSHLFIYVMINGAPGDDKSMPPPEESSARTEEELVEILETYLKERARLASANRFLETAAKDIDLAKEIAEIFEEWWDLMEEHHVQIAIIEKSAAEFSEMAQIYDKYGRKYTTEQIEKYLSLRIRQGVIRNLNSIRGMARAMTESLSWFAWKQFEREPVPHYQKPEILPDLVSTYVRGLEASSSINERKQS
jgi:AcrR family transcriptional regulator